MRKSAIVLAAVLLLLLPAGPRTAAAQAPEKQREIIYLHQPPGIMEAALSSCAGGAILGALISYSSGVGIPTATAGLWCAMSFGASLISSGTMWTWRTAAGGF